MDHLWACGVRIFRKRLFQKNGPSEIILVNFVDTKLILTIPPIFRRMLLNLPKNFTQPRKKKFPTEFICDSMNAIRNYFLKLNYDYLFILESNQNNIYPVYPYQGYYTGIYKGSRVKKNEVVLDPQTRL